MMISPASYIDTQKNKTYKELLREQNKLLSDIKNFENGNIKKSNIIIDPRPEVIYQCNLMYLGELSKLISKKYNKEYIMFDESQDEKE